MVELPTVQEVARRLAVCEGTVYSLCTSRKMRHVRLGAGRGAIRISEDALAEYLAGATVNRQEDVSSVLASVVSEKS